MSMTEWTEVPNMRRPLQTLYVSAEIKARADCTTGKRSKRNARKRYYRLK